jgi:hypothetical protein
MRRPTRKDLTMKSIYIVVMGISGLLLVSPAVADSTFFSSNGPDGKIGMASRPTTMGKVEIEAADDFILSSETGISSASFTGLVSGAAPSLGQVVVEIYRVFPKDSDTVRQIKVPTRANSPSDVEFESRDTADGDLTFSTSVLNTNFTASNSVLNGIQPKTGGEGSITGEEVQFNVNFAKPFDLPADHYFFVPQVEVDGGEFFWLSAAKPIVPPGTPFAPDLQTWMRDEPLQPDWLRVGTDIVGGDPAPAFNASFSLSGAPVPEGNSLALLVGAGVLAVPLACRRRWLNKRTISAPA